MCVMNALFDHAVFWFKMSTICLYMCVCVCVLPTDDVFPTMKHVLAPGNANK